MTATLLETLPAGHDIFIMSLRDGDKPAPAPHWTTHALDEHPRCPFCGADQ